MLSNSLSIYITIIVRTGIYIKLDDDVISHFRVAGPGYQARMNAALRAAMLTSNGPTQTGRSSSKQRAIAHAQVAFERYFAQAFWHLRPEALITEHTLPDVINGLRRYGGRDGFREAEKICRLMNSNS